MRKIVAAVRSFGILNYLAKKAYRASPSLYRRYAEASAGFAKTAYGVEMRENWNDATFRMCVFGGHGRALADLLASRTDPFHFVDVGANQGLFTLLAVQNPNCISVIAFEPVPDTFRLLEVNVFNARAQDKVVLEMSAISSQSGLTQISVPPEHSGGATISGRKDTEALNIDVRTICATELNRIFPEAHEIVVKIDVEGHEVTVLKQLLQLRATDHISCVFCEVDLRWVHYDEIATLLRGAGLENIVKIGSGQHFDILAKRRTST